MTLENIEIINKNPTPDEFNRFRECVGWDKIPDKLVEIGLRNSLISVCAYSNKELIGFGRIVGDDAIYFYVQDMIVNQPFQNKRVGKLIMNKLMTELKSKYG